jgi:hypothetical protein
LWPGRESVGEGTGKKVTRVLRMPQTAES